MNLRRRNITFYARMTYAVQWDRYKDAHYTLAHNGNNRWVSTTKNGCVRRAAAATVFSRHRLSMSSSSYVRNNSCNTLCCACLHWKKMCFSHTFCRCCNLPPFRLKILLINIFLKKKPIVGGYTCVRHAIALAFLFSQSLAAHKERGECAGEKIFCDFPLHFTERRKVVSPPRVV